MAQQNFRVKRGLEVGLGATVLSATFDGKIGIRQANPTAALDVNGNTELDHLNVSGITTFNGDVKLSGASTDLDVSGTIRTPNLHSNGTSLTIRGGGNTSGFPEISLPNSTNGSINILGKSGASNQITLDTRGSGNLLLKHNTVTKATIDSNGIDIVGITETDDLKVTGVSTFTSNIDATHISITGVGTFPTLDTTNGTINYLTSINTDISGIGSITTLQATTAAIGTIDVTTLTANTLSGDLTGGVTGNVTGNSDTATTLQTSRDFSVSGDVATASAISFDGSSDVDLAVTLSSTFSANTTGSIQASEFGTGAVGSAIRITSNTISGPATMTLDPAGVGDNTGKVVIAGDLQIDGTTTTVNSTTITVDDKNLVLGSGAADDAAASGGGITIESGDGNKTFEWIDSTDSWTSSENLDIKNGKTYKINGVDILSATILGSSVITSSLTSVGTLGSLNVTGNVTAGSFTGPLTGNVIGDVTGNVTGNLVGIADEAVTLQSSRNFSITGDVTAVAVGFDGSSAVNLSASLSSTFSANTTGSIQASSFTKTSGTSSQFLKADGSSDNTAYIDLADLSVTSNAAGTASLSYDNSTGAFTYTPPDLSSYIDLTDLSVTSNAAGTASLSYDNSTGAFTYTPPDLSSYIDLTDLSVTSNAAGTASLSYNNSTGAFTYTPPDLSSYIDLTDLSVTSNAAGTAALTYDNSTGAFTYTPPDLSSYIDLTDLSVTSNAVGTAALTYDNSTGAFTYTPPDLSSYIDLTDLSVTSNAAGTASLSYNNSTGAFTYTPPDLSSYIDLADLSVTSNAAGTAALTYDNSTGAFTYTPPDLSSYLTSYTETDTLDSVTGRTNGNTTTNSIIVGGDGSASGITLSDGKIDIRTSTGNVAAIDFYCESSNAHYTRIQSAAHSAYSGNATVTLPSSTGTLLLTNGDGSNLTNIVTTLTGGTGITVSASTGSVTINGLELSDISVGTPSAASGSGSLSYDNSTGAFTYTPPDLSSYLTTYTETQTLDDVLTLGATTSQDITSTGKILYSNVYSAIVDLPSASTYHGMFAHVHGTGKGYFAHSGNWIQLLDVGSSIDSLTDVDTSTVAPTDGQSLVWDSTTSKWEPGTIAASSTGITVKQVQGSGGTVDVTATSITELQFDKNTGFNVTDLGSGAAFVDFGSAFKTWYIDGQTTLVASGEDEIELIAGTNIQLATTLTHTGSTTKAITISASGGGATAFTGLSDTPASMGTAGQYLAVNSGGTALEFVAAPSGGGTSLTVQTRNGSAGAEGGEATSISKLTFNSASGFSVSNPNTGEAFISLGSAFAPWSVDGQTTLTPEGEEEVEFIAGSGITITTNNSATPKSITFTSSGGGGGGGASSIDDLTDVDTTTTAPSSGQVLKWNGTNWIPASDSTGSGGGGGGGGDGTASLGQNSRLSYDGGLLTLTTSTQINDAIDQINGIMVKLAPPTPPPLSTKTMSINGTYSAIKSGTHELLSVVTDQLSPETSVVSNFYDGAQGTLSFTVNSVADGSIALSEGVGTEGNTGSDGGLTITTDTDPYAGQQGKEFFWEQLSAKVKSTSDLTAGETHNYTMSHSITGDASLDFFIDQLNTGANLSVSGESVDTTQATTDKGFISGVPTFTYNSYVDVSCTVNGAVTKAYNSTKICAMTGSVVSTKNVSPEADTYSEGDAITITNESVTIGNNKFSDGDFDITLKGFNSKGDAGSPTTLTVPGRVDTKSDETSRITSGSGQYPTTGYGDSYDSTQLLSANEELQLINGKYEYPSTDYSSNALVGPDYSSLTGTRWVTFAPGTASSALDGVVTINATGLTANALNATVTDGIDMYLKIEGSTGWFNINEGPNYSSGTLSADGDKPLLYGGSDKSTKSLAWGTVPLSGQVYVRLGLPAGSNIKITGVTFS